MAKHVQAQVQTIRAPATRTDFTLVVTNNSSFTLVKVSVHLEIEAVCNPLLRMSIKALATVGPVRPGAPEQFSLILPVEPRCPTLFDWTAKTRVVDVEIAD